MGSGEKEVVATLIGAVLTVLMLVGPPPAFAQGDPCAARAAVEAPDRSVEDQGKDAARRPLELLCFAGVEPGMRVLDLLAGGGYTTELLARVVGDKGKVIAHNTPLVVEKFLKGSFKKRQEKAVMANVEHWVAEFDQAIPPGTSDLDLITAVFVLHDVAPFGGDRQQLNRAFYNALRPGGILLVVDHAANPGVGDSEGGTTHRIEAELVKSELEAVGFDLADEALFLHRAEDPRSEPFFNMGSGEVDQFVLRFRKPVR